MLLPIRKSTTCFVYEKYSKISDLCTHILSNSLHICIGYWNINTSLFIKKYSKISDLCEYFYNPPIGGKDVACNISQRNKFKNVYIKAIFYMTFFYLK